MKYTTNGNDNNNRHVYVLTLTVSMFEKNLNDSFSGRFKAEPQITYRPSDGTNIIAPYRYDQNKPSSIQ